MRSCDGTGAGFSSYLRQLFQRSLLLAQIGLIDQTRNICPPPSTPAFSRQADNSVLTSCSQSCTASCTQLLITAPFSTPQALGSTMQRYSHRKRTITCCIRNGVLGVMLPFTSHYHPCHATCESANMRMSILVPWRQYIYNQLTDLVDYALMTCLPLSKLSSRPAPAFSCT